MLEKTMPNLDFVKPGVNYNLISRVAGNRESVALVESAGVDANTFMEILTHTAFTGSAYAGYGPMIVNRAYTPRRILDGTWSQGRSSLSRIQPQA